MKILHASGGEEILIDDSDFNFLRQFSWSVNGAGYAHAHIPKNFRPAWQKRTDELLHRFLLIQNPQDWVEHKDGNRLNCQRGNLLLCSPLENLRFKPVTLHQGIVKHGERWYARIKVHGKNKSLGGHSSFDLALLARIIGELRYWRFAGRVRN